MKLYTEQAAQWLRAHEEETKDLLRQLCRIPAPSHKEEKRAAFCRDWLKKNGAKTVWIDEALNVVCPYGGSEQGPWRIFMAHTDTVFPDTDPMPMREENGILYAPGSGDDTANVAVLLMLAKFCLEEKPALSAPILFVCNSCEEGLGNLKGSRAICKAYGHETKEMVSLDGTLGWAVNHAVGSRRYRVQVQTEGGHSFGSFGNRNAIQVLSQMIVNLYQMHVPDKAKTTYNVGTIQGGTSVNTIAQEAAMLFEYRSEDRECLDVMEQQFRTIVEETRPLCQSLSVELLGERPCDGDVDWKKHAELEQRCRQAYKAVTGQELTLSPGSTDCNTFLNAGVPCFCTGCVSGEGAHTREEWVELDSLGTGLQLGARLLLTED